MLSAVRRQSFPTCLYACACLLHPLPCRLLPLPCPQEEGNIPYVLDNGVGAFETDPAKIADIMQDWLAKENRQEFRAMAHRSRALGKPQAVYHIVEELAQLADSLGAEARLPARKCCSSSGKRGSSDLPVGRLVAA